MTKQQIINQTAQYVKTKLSGESSGHDWWYAYRVWKMAVNLAKQEKADLFVVELAALLHDIADWKFNNRDDHAAEKIITKLLSGLGVDQAATGHVCEIVNNLSFKGAGVASKIDTIEGMVVQDADRLDAMGAIGISRVFAYGGQAGREIYNPEIKPKKQMTFAQYKNNRGSSINHFYEKLLLLHDLMNTKAAKKIAQKRHRIMERYLAEFFQEWGGKA